MFSDSKFLCRYQYDLSESLAAAWQRVLELPKEHHKNSATPPLYIRYVRFSARVSYQMPLIVFDLDYTVGDPFDGTQQTSIKL